MIRAEGVPSAVLAFLLAALAGAAIAYDPTRPSNFVLLAVYLVAGSALAMADHARHASGPARTGAVILGTALALILISMRGWPMFWICTAGVLGSRAYVSGPCLARTPLASPVAIVLFGPLAAAGASVALLGHVAPGALAAGFPLGFLADAARRAARERAPIVPAADASGVGQEPPRPTGIVFDLTAGFALLAGLSLFGTIPTVALAGFVAAPLAIQTVRKAGGRAEPDRAGAEGTRRAHRVQIVFGVAIVVALFLARILATRSA